MSGAVVFIFVLPVSSIRPKYTAVVSKPYLLSIYCAAGICRRKWQPVPSVLAWETPWTGKPGRLQFMRLQRVGHD